MLWNHIPEGQTLLRVGDPCRNICYVITGLVKLGTLSPGGSEVLLALRGANTVLGYETVMLNAKLPFCAMSLTRCDVAFVHTNQFKQDLIRLPDLAPSMQTILSEQALTFMRRVYELTAEPAESRLISTILSLAGQLSVPASRTYTRIDIKNRELANLVSITPEHLSRLLCQLKKNGLVDRQQGWLIVPDLLRLAEYLASYDSRDGGL
jgi:CRP-like cAMP-binding protein